MKKRLLIAAALLGALAAYSQPVPIGGAPLPPQSVTAPAKEPANYLVHVDWRDPKGESDTLEVLTAEGNFEVNTIQKAVKINNNDVPVTLRFSGTLKVLDDTKGRLKLFLGRTVPYITGSSGGPNPTSSYSQMSVGLDSSVIVKFDKPETIQNDENGQISVVVKRVTD